MLLLAATATVVYVLLAAAAAVLVRSTPAPPPVGGDALPSISVIVAARDEETALPACLDALAEQDYPAERIEFIVADDHSTDATPDIVRQRTDRDERFRLVTVADADDGLHGKAAALHAAIGEAAGSLVLVTDADCRPSPAWARNLAAAFINDPQAGIVCGVTTVEGRSVRSALQRLDWLLLLGVSSAAARAGLPLTAMGNNMAIRRSAYEAVGGYPALPFSVTEDYALFQAIHLDTPYTVHLLARPELRVDTEPLGRLRDVFAQRRRWARGGLRARPWVYGFYGAVFATHVLLAVATVLAPLYGLALLAAKGAADAAVIVATARRTASRPRWRLLPLYEAALFAYVLAMPAALALAPRIRWKERVH